MRHWLHIPAWLIGIHAALVVLMYFASITGPAAEGEAAWEYAFAIIDPITLVIQTPRSVHEYHEYAAWFLLVGSVQWGVIGLAIGAVRSRLWRNANATHAWTFEADPLRDADNTRRRQPHWRVVLLMTHCLACYIVAAILLIAQMDVFFVEWWVGFAPLFLPIAAYVQIGLIFNTEVPIAPWHGVLLALMIAACYPFAWFVIRNAWGIPFGRSALAGLVAAFLLTTAIVPEWRTFGSRDPESQRMAQKVNERIIAAIVRGDSTQAIEQLIKDNAVSIRGFHLGGLYAVHIAVIENRPDVLRLLLDHGSPWQVTGYPSGPAYGQQPLHLAAEQGNLEMVRMLCEYGAWVNGEDLFGRTPTDLAIEAGADDVVRYLNSFPNRWPPKHHREAAP